MSIELSTTVRERAATEEVVWLTCTSSDGRPLPTPVWFVVDGEDFIVYTDAGSPKVRMLGERPEVALNFNTDQHGGSVVVISGTAALVDGAPPPTAWPGYLAKYARGIEHLGMTPESFDAAYVQQLRITPSRVRAFA